LPQALASPVLDPDPDLFADLIGRIARHGDRAAFARLFGYFAPRLKTTLLRQGLSPAEAEDQAVAVMTAVWRQASNFDPRQADASTWIFCILRNARVGTLGARSETAPRIAPAPVVRALRPTPLRQAPFIQSRKAALISRG
jgi:RNA polymerase sigma-70 factor (ECF subfamily)